ncbi:MAG TPA: hypothetical protein VFA67_09135, partial [Candidatus Sulfotelmatobacter sp.]|nr:hypothetical protein [Candidatus Sulfotelmatobacter sp.]
EVKDVLFRLTLASVITGRVDDEDGEPTALIQVIALRRPTEDELEDQERLPGRSRELQPAGVTQTDDRGQYRLFGLKPGEYYVKAVEQLEPNYRVPETDMDLHEALGTQYAPIYYPGVTQMGQAETVMLTPGEEAHAEFVMRRIKTADISGRVIGPDGKPADAFLYLEEVPAADYGIFYAIDTDTKGEFKIKGVAPGSYVLHADQHSQEDERHQAAQKIEVGSDNVESITLSLGRGVSFSGLVRVSAAGKVSFERMYVILASPDDQSANAWARVKKDGTFQFTDVPEGTFAFSVGGLEENWYLKSVQLGADDVLAGGLVVEKGETQGTLQVVVSNEGAEVAGSVTQDDKPVIGARVRIMPDPETRYNRLRRRTTSTDQSGRFSFVVLAPGQYRLAAKISAAGENLSSEPKSVSLSEHDHKSIELTIPSTPAQ